MRSLAWALVLCGCLFLTSGREPPDRVIEVSTAEELATVFREPLENVTVKLAPGRYVLVSRNGEIPTGTWKEATGVTSVTVGLKISGRNVRLLGPQDGSAELIATAQIRLHFDDCERCGLDRVALTAVTPGEPDSTIGAAVLVTRSAVRIVNCAIRDATTPPAADGIVGATGATLEVLSCEISGNGTGVLVLEDGRATLRNNLIEGISCARAGLMVAQDAAVVAERNHVRNFNRGVLLAGSPSLELRAGIIEEIEGSGIQSSAAGLGRVRIEENVVFRCGGPGIALRAEGDQRASRNFIVETGRIQPGKSAILVYGARADAAVRRNTLYGNAVGDPALDRDVPREIFWRERRSWTRTYRNTPVGVDGRHRFHESAFLTRYGRWSN